MFNLDISVLYSGADVIAKEGRVFNNLFITPPVYLCIIEQGKNNYLCIFI